LGKNLLILILCQVCLCFWKKTFVISILVAYKEKGYKVWHIKKKGYKVWHWNFSKP